ncbi:MAG: hypothetical protein RL748_1760, partial [Pseudomonadota bacterium]
MKSFQLWHIIGLCLLICGAVQAQTNSATPSATSATTSAVDVSNASKVCSPLHMSKLDEPQKIAAMHAPLNRAIATLDSAKIEFSSPTLAAGKMSYVTITPNFADNLSRVCIVGYFYMGSKEEGTEPLEVDHIEIINPPKTADGSQPDSSTRVYFRAPNPGDFHGMRDAVFWRFWARHEPVTLKFAAFDYDSDSGKIQKFYFGHQVPVYISHRNASIFAAWFFAISCYLCAAFTIWYSTRRQSLTPASLPNSLRTPSRLRAALRRISPWYLAGSSGHASLSQLQMLLFTLIIATLLFYQWIRTGLLQEISTDLLYLMGISTIGAGGAQVTNSIKKNLDPKVYDYLQQLGWFTAPVAGAHTTAMPSQLLLTNGRFDIYKFQMAVFTLVIAAYVIAAGGDQLGNIQISATLLSLMGMSQGVY